MVFFETVLSRQLTPLPLPLRLPLKRSFSHSIRSLADVPPPPTVKRVPRSDKRPTRFQSLVSSRNVALSRLRSRFRRPSRRTSILTTILVSIAGLYALYEFSTPAQHAVLAVERCATIAYAVLRAVIDYKLLFRKTWEDTEEGRKQRHLDYESTHWKAATRLMEALRSLGGIYIKAS